jgi:hypothetical protein
VLRRGRSTRGEEKMLIHIEIEVERDNAQYEAIVSVDGPIRVIPFLSFIRVLDAAGQERVVKRLFVAQQSIL